jgi:hypothetical protein
MKQHITAEDLMELTDSQKRSLQGLWAPRKYDQVLANICIDVENEAYRQIEFILGDIRVFGTNLYLWDYRVKIADGNDNENDCVCDSNDSENDNAGKDVDTNENTHNKELENDNDPDYPLQSASISESDEADTLLSNADSAFFYYNKEDCLPLLSIGQMMEMLRKNNYGELYFYATIGIGEEDSGVGRDGNERDYQSQELCDALWECLKKML